MPRRRTAALVAAALLCGVGGSAATAARHAANGGTVIKIRFAKKIKRAIVVDVHGRTLYLFTADTGGTPTCTDASCAPHWPPLLTAGAPVAGTGIKASLLGTATRPDGKTQVTYNKHPLYYYRGWPGQSGYPPRDTKPGQLHGQGVFSVWWVVSPKGAAIHKRP